MIGKIAAVEAVLVSELAVDGLRRAVADDHSRRTLTVGAADRVLRVSGDDLTVLAEWPLAEEAPGVHATRISRSCQAVIGRGARAFA